MPSTASTLVAAGALLVATAAAGASDAPALAFHFFLLGIPVSAAAALIAFAQVVDAANGGRPTALAELRAVLAAALLALFVVGASARSPVSLALGAPGLARTALGLALGVLALQALAALAPVRR